MRMPPEAPGVWSRGGRGITLCLETPSTLTIPGEHPAWLVSCPDAPSSVLYKRDLTWSPDIPMRPVLIMSYFTNQ